MDFDAVASEAEEADSGFGVGVDLRGGEEVDSLFLSVEARRSVVAIARPLAVVDAEVTEEGQNSGSKGAAQ